MLNVETLENRNLCAGLDIVQVGFGTVETPTAVLFPMPGDNLQTAVISFSPPEAPIGVGDILNDFQIESLF